MKVETSTITKMLLSDLDRLDPVTVLIDNFEPGKGKITIECYGQCWSNYWGGMSGMTVQEFFQDCDLSYLTDKLAPELTSEVLADGPELVTAAKNQVKQLMDDGEIDQLEAVFYLAQIEQSLAADGMKGNEQLLLELFGYEGIYNLPQKPNHEYEYLCRILEAIKVAFAEENDDDK